MTFSAAACICCMPCSTLNLPRITCATNEMVAFDTSGPYGAGGGGVVLAIESMAACA